MSAILIFCIFASNINIRKIMINCSLVIPPLVGWTLVCSGSHGVGFGNNNLNSKVWAELSIHLEVPCRRWQINGVVLGPVSRFIQYCLAILMLSLFLFFLCRGKCKLGQMSSERERESIYSSTAVPLPVSSPWSTGGMAIDVSDLLPSCAFLLASMIYIDGPLPNSLTT